MADEPQPATPARIGRYAVERELGRGGGGVVYLATDPELDREVALKAVPPEMAADGERLQRLEREAKAFAALSHPHVAAIHGIETHDGARYLVLEYVAGETLDAALARGPLSLPDAIECARQVADGLEAAHERGLVHRDLKPANLRRTPEGTVKILDFGLAKELPSGAASSSDSSLGLTTASAVVGTPAYLSPEQACGRRIDRRTDVWAFGCVLFELLTGRKAFAADSLPDLFRAILDDPVDLGALPARTPARVRELLARCLEKDPRQRLRDIGDARLELERALAERAWTGTSAVAAVVRSAGARRARAWPLALAFVLGAAAWAGWSALAGGSGSAVSPKSMRVSVHVGGGDLELRVGTARFDNQFRIAPDGRTIAVRAVELGAAGAARPTPRLFLRDADRFEPRVVPGSDNLIAFAFAPDGRSLCMVVPRSAETSAVALVRVPVVGGAPPDVIAPWEDVRAVWLETDEIVSGVGPPFAMLRVPVAGGAPSRLEIRPRGFESAYSYGVIRALPGGRRVLVQIQLYDEQGYVDCVGVVDMGDGAAELLVRDAGSAAYVPTGHLLFTRGDQLLAVPFDVDAGAVRGDPVRVLDGLRTETSWQNAWFDVALGDDPNGGTLVYRPGGVQGARRSIALFDGDGTITPWSTDRMAFEERIESSWDGSRFAVTRVTPAGLYEVWGSELDRPRLRRLVADRLADCNSAILSARGDFIVYIRFGQQGTNGHFRVPFDGSADPVLVLEADPNAPDQLLFEVAPNDSHRDCQFAELRHGYGVGRAIRRFRRGRRKAHQLDTRVRLGAFRAAESC